MPLAVIFDIDGTLVDTNYQHALAWYRAFRQHGVVDADLADPSRDRDRQRPRRRDARRRAGRTKARRHLARCRRPALSGDDRRSRADEGRTRTPRRPQAGRTPDDPGQLRRRRRRPSGTSTCSTPRSFVDGYTTSADVKASKPEPDIVNAAIEKAGGGPAVMIGDSTWDCKAATRPSCPASVSSPGVSQSKNSPKRARPSCSAPSSTSGIT